MRPLTSMTHGVRSFLADAYDRAFRYADWNVGLVQDPIHAFLRPGFRPEVRWLPPPRPGKYLADPFAMVQNGRVYLLYEEFDYRSRRGVIGAGELTEGPTLSEPRTVIELPFHISYPYLVRHRGEIYCVPETSRSREISLFKAEAFPYRWAKVRTLLDGVAGLDSTLFEHDGRWWLTSAVRQGDPPYSLRVWYAPDLFGPWKPHADNPVQTDRRLARPAGTPFVHQGELYRPVQDSSAIYGGRIVIHRVVQLTPTVFEEEPAAFVEPDPDGPYPDGLHTLSAAGNVTLVDGQRLVFVKTAVNHLPRDPPIVRWLPRVMTLFNRLSR